MAKSKVKLRIADIIIGMQSNFPLVSVTEKDKKMYHPERYNNFFYSGEKEPDISIDVEVVGKLPEVKKTRPVFITYHFQDGKENWRLLEGRGVYVYKSPLQDKTQLMIVNRKFDKIKAYLLSKDIHGVPDLQKREFIKKNKGTVWAPGDIIYDFLQVLLINYFAKRKDGIFVHAVGIKDLDGSGLLFAGKSGTGKSTTARLWHNHSKALVLNDDRIIVRKFRDRFFAYGSPWHGDFSDYLASRIESAALKKLFFIYHFPRNDVRRISEKEAFGFLYPALFPTFWDKECLENIASFSLDLLKNMPCFRLGFVNDKRIIKFVRTLNTVPC